MNKKRFLNALALIYFIVVFYLTILMRTPTEEPQLKLTVFWSWHSVIAYHSKAAAFDILKNIFLLLPIGFLFCLRDNISLRKTTIVGVCVSGGIEISQLILHRGYFEWDDIFHNTIGCMLGYGFGKVILSLLSSHHRESGF